MRIAVTSDLHYDGRGRLTSPASVEEVAVRMKRESPAAIVLAGDQAHGATNFEDCLGAFRGSGCPVGVLAGNHDVWRDRDKDLSSRDLFETILPAACARQEAIWLEGEVLRVGDVAIVGTMAWYDYSAVHEGATTDPDMLQVLKGQLNNDAHWIDWPWTDREVAARLRAAFLRRLAGAVADRAVRAVLVVTHVPILEEQIVRKPWDERWSMSNAYFGNLTLGRDVALEPKVTCVVSGHTHMGREGRRERTGAPPLEYRVVPSDYGAPRYLVVDV